MPRTGLFQTHTHTHISDEVPHAHRAVSATHLCMTSVPQIKWKYLNVSYSTWIVFGCSQLFIPLTNGGIAADAFTH